MKKRDYSELMSKMADAYTRHSPKSAKLHEEAVKYLIDGGSHNLRLLNPFPPKIVSALGAWVRDEDGHNILDFWQGHYANILGHNPTFMTTEMAELFDEGYGLQTGLTDKTQAETAKLICETTGAERVRFTCSGAQATMYSIMMARAFTGRDLVMKVGGGWHGANPWGLKGVGWQEGFEKPDSAGIPVQVTDETIITHYNDAQKLEDCFKEFGEKTACFLVEPVIGTGGLMPAKKEYMTAARELCDKYGVLLIHDEIISGFRFHPGNAGALYAVTPDLITLGKAVGGGMPVAVVAGREDILSLTGAASGAKVKFSGGTYSAHPASLHAAKLYMQYLVDNKDEIYSKLQKIARQTRGAMKRAFKDEGINVRFAGDRNSDIPDNSLHMPLFPYNDDLDFDTPDEVYNPANCDVELSFKVLQLAFLMQDVFCVLGVGSTTAAHTNQDIDFFANACSNTAKMVKPYL